MAVRHEDDDGRKSTKIVYIENHLQPDGSVKKKAWIDEDPEYTYFMTKDPELFDKPRNFVETEHVRPITVRYDNLLYDIAKQTDQLDYYKACKANGKYRETKNVLKHKDVHLADLDIADYKIDEWLRLNKQEVIPLRKAYFDIEVDIMSLPEGEFPDEEKAEYPVALLSYLHQPTMEIHSFILRNPENHSQTAFLEFFEAHTEEYKEAFLEELNAPNEENGKKPPTPVSDIHFHIFDEEMDLITSFFTLVKKDRPDFAAGWNLPFDMLTLAGRIRKHKKRPEDIMCPKSFPYKQVWLEKDSTSTDFSKRKSTLEVTGYTQYVDLLECFAQIRATMGKRESYSLDSILMEEIGESKYDYEGTIQDALYVDFEGFMKYSVYDSYRLYQLEEKNKDLDLLYSMGIMTSTRFKKVMTKTVSIRNLAMRVLRENGFTLSNNRNKFIEQKAKEKFRGAWVAEAVDMDHAGIRMEGFQRRSSRVFENVIDEDLASLYPSILLAFNIDAETMLGKIFFEDNPEDNDEFPMRISEGDPILVGHDYLGLPTVEELIHELDN
jgi:DNA polymerase elongation subunit (family B)